MEPLIFNMSLIFCYAVGNLTQECEKSRAVAETQTKPLRVPAGAL